MNRVPVTEEMRPELEARLANLKIQLADHERHHQRNAASLIRDDIAWIEIALGHDDPSHPLIPRAEINDVRQRENRRMALVDKLLTGYDELIRYSLDYDGPRKYQSVMKLCSMADKARGIAVHDVAGHQAQLGGMIHVDGDPEGDYIAGGDDLGMMNVRAMNRLVRPAAQAPVLNDLTRMLSDYLDSLKEVGEKQREERAALQHSLFRSTPLLDLRSLLDARSDVVSLPEAPERAAQLAALDRKINDAINALDNKEQTNDSNASRADSPADSSLVLPELPRGHSPDGDGGRHLRSGADEADDPGREGDRRAVGDREQEGMERRVPRAFHTYRFPAGSAVEGGEAAPEAPQARSHDDLGGPVL